MSQARGLTVFISDLRNCTNPEQERKRVEKEMAHIRQKFRSDANMNGTPAKRAACLKNRRAAEFCAALQLLPPDPIAPRRFAHALLPRAHRPPSPELAARRLQ